MENTDSFDRRNNRKVKPWINFLDNEMGQERGDDPVSYFLAEVIRRILLSTKSRTLEAAELIDSYYWYDYLASNPLAKSFGDNGTAAFLGAFYRLVFDTAMLIPSAGPDQDVLVQLLVELHRLPPPSCRLWNVRYSLPRSQVAISYLTGGWL